MIRKLAPGATAVIAAAVGFQGEALAQESGNLRFSVSAGVTHSDNIHRTPTDEQSDTSVEAGLQLGLEREGGRLQSRIETDAQYRTYLDDTYDDELVGGLDASLTYWFVPERFAWVLEDNFGQTFIDPRQVETPANRQNTNYLSTGPDFVFDFGDRTRLSLQGRWSDASYEESTTDNQRVSGTVGLLRRLGLHTSASLNGTTESVEYDEGSANADYDRHSAYVGFDARGARTTLNVEAGYTRVKASSDSSDAPLLRLTLTRELTARSSFTLTAGKELTDSAESFRRDRGIRGVTVGNEDAVVSRDPYESDYASLAWNLTGSRSTLLLGADWRREDHESTDTLNRDSIGASAALSRRLSPKLTAILDGRWTREDFDESGVDFDEWSASLGFGWDVSRSLAVNLRGEHVDGSGDTIAGPGLRDFTENRATLSLRFTPRR